jgi:hypothetical protein
MHRRRTRRMRFGPDKPPWTVFVRKFSVIFLCGIMLLESPLDVISRADIESALRILKHIDKIYIVLFIQPPRAGLEPAT